MQFKVVTFFINYASTQKAMRGNTAKQTHAGYNHPAVWQKQRLGRPSFVNQV